MQEEQIALNTKRQEQVQSGTRAGGHAGLPAGELWYDRIVALLSTLLVTGIYLVGWATSHDQSTPGRLTLWYAVLLAGFVLLVAWFVLTWLGSRAQGSSWRRAWPRGYGLAVPGALLFVGGVLGTFLWQAVAGSLSALETLLLPTTILALLGAILLVSGPLCATWWRFPSGAAPGWAGLFPLVLSLTWVFSLGTFQTQFAHPWTQVTTVTDTRLATVYSDVYTMRADGTAQTRLTRSSQDTNFGPSWSPDGRKIAFAFRSGSAPSNIYVMNADGTDTVPLTHLSLGCYLQQWSPDGRKLVFLAQQGNDVNTAAVYVIDVDGSHLRRLTHEDAREYGAVWSPDGTRIAFGSLRGGSWHVNVMDADGSHVHVLTSGNKPTWSPDGRRIVFTSDVSGHNDLYVMNADGSQVQLLTGYGDHAAWSPDGQHIAFESDRTGNQEIYLMNPDGSEITNLTRNPGVESQLPAWSPDSGQITYMAQRFPSQLDAVVPQSLGIASILIQAAALVGVILLLIRRWQVPFGTFTLMITLNGLLLSLLAEQYELLPAALFTGLFADVLAFRFTHAGERPVRSALLAASVPVVWSGLYFLTLVLTQGIGWSLPFWTGSILLAGLVGLALSFVLRLPRNNSIM